MTCCCAVLLTGRNSVLERLPKTPTLIPAGPGLRSPFGATLRQAQDNRARDIARREKVFATGSSSVDRLHGNRGEALASSVVIGRRSGPRPSSLPAVEVSKRAESESGHLGAI